MQTKTKAGSVIIATCLLVMVLSLMVFYAFDGYKGIPIETTETIISVAKTTLAVSFGTIVLVIIGHILFNLKLAK